MLHALFVLGFMLLLAPWMGYVPLAALAAVLLVVAWNIAEFESFRHTLSAPKGDRLVLLLTFGLTVFFDLTLAIEAGLVVAAFVFMGRMANAVDISSESPDATTDGQDQRARLPPGVEAFQISGPLFFGAANRLDEVFDQFRAVAPRVFILRMRRVPLVDASGVHAFRALLQRCRKQRIALVVSGLQAQPQHVFARMDLAAREGELHFVDDYDKALALAAILARPTGTHAAVRG
jgi:SulP family sulfate permease